MLVCVWLGVAVCVWLPVPVCEDEGVPVRDGVCDAPKDALALMLELSLLVALDIVDPGSAEALLHRHAALALDGRTRVEAAPRRVVIGAAGAPGIARNAPLSVTPLHGVNGAGRPETLGPVAAIEIVRTAPAAN